MAVKVAISGYYGFKNFGDELILSVLTSYLKNSGADITVFSVNPKFTQKVYGVKAVKTFSIKAIINTIYRTDVLISGGGSLFQDVTSINSILYYAFVLGLAQIFRKKTIIFAQGIGPLNNWFSRYLVKLLFKKANIITVRDENSHKLLQTMGIQSKIVIDPVFCAEFPKLPKNNILGVQLRGKCNINSNFLPNLAHVIAKMPFREVQLFPLQSSIDLAICQKFAQLVHDFAPEKVLSIVTDNQTENLIKLDTLISMRFHALVAGLKTGVKCCGINYDPKISALCKKYNIPAIQFNDTPQIILNKITNLKIVTLPDYKFDYLDNI